MFLICCFLFAIFIFPSVGAAPFASSIPKANSGSNTDGDDVISLFGESLVRVDEIPVLTPAMDALGDIQYLGVYFTASWCSYCSLFNPTLMKFYQRIKSEGKPFGLVIVTPVDSESDLQYHSYAKSLSGDWFVLPFSNASGIQRQLMKRYEVTGFPQLVLLELQPTNHRVPCAEHPEGHRRLSTSIITLDARQLIMENDPYGQQFPFKTLQQSISSIPRSLSKVWAPMNSAGRIASSCLMAVDYVVHLVRSQIVYLRSWNSWFLQPLSASDIWNGILHLQKFLVGILSSLTG